MRVATTCGASVGLLALAAVAEAAPLAERVPVKDAEAGGQVSRLHVLFVSDLAGRYVAAGCQQRGASGRSLASLADTIATRRRQIEAHGGSVLTVAAGSSLRPDISATIAFGRDDQLARGVGELIRHAGFSAMALGGFDFGSSPRVLRNYMRALRAQGVALLASNVSCDDPRDFRCTDRPRRRVLFLQRGRLRVAVLAVLRQDLPQRILQRSKGSLVVADAVQATRQLLSKQGKKVDLLLVLADLNHENDTPVPVLRFSDRLQSEVPTVIVANAMYKRGKDTAIAQIHRSDGRLIVGTTRFGHTLGEIVLSYQHSGQASSRLNGVRVHQYPVEPVSGADEQNRTISTLKRRLCRQLHRPLGPALADPALDRDRFINYLLHVMRNALQTDVALINDSAIATSGFPIAGGITAEAVMRAVRTGSHLATVSLSGTELIRQVGPYLDTRQNLHSIGLSREGRHWFVNGRPIDADQRYRIATTAFVASGGDKLLRALVTLKNSRRTLSATLSNYLRKGVYAADNDPRLDAERDFVDLAERWAISATSSFGAGISNVAISNGSAGDRYALPLLRRDHVTSTNIDLRLSLNADTRNHTLQTQLQLQYGKTWTRSQGEASETVSAETLDRVFISLLYRSDHWRNASGNAAWYLPQPYLESILITELTSSGRYTDGLGVERNYHYADLSGTAGLGFTPHPALFVKLGYASRAELATPQSAGPQGRTAHGVYLGYRLQRWSATLLGSRSLTLDSRLDAYLTNFFSNFRREVTLQTKASFSLTRTIRLSTTHRAFLFGDGDRSTSLANDISVGLDILLDYRRQFF